MNQPYFQNLEPLAQLQELLFERDDFEALARRLPEPRMALEKWRDVLHGELLSLFRWGLIRARESLDDQGAGQGYGQEVLCLLPYYGFCLHAIRRAAPFALMGIPTTVSVRHDRYQEASAVIGELAVVLGVKDWLRVSEESSAELVRQFHGRDGLIVLTGKQSTYTSLRSRYPDAWIIAATGCCGVVLSVEEQPARVIEEQRQEHRLPVSCSNHGYTVLAEALTPQAAVLAINGARPAVSSTVQELLGQLHPSIVLTPPSALPLPDDLGGYSLLACEESAAASLDGFGRDPLGGWPGDYRI
ncbi:hypothetical protein BK645_22565 [Pseudomonas protegens]|uniref:hypothetical protein n=1 Tax=Pseudomonas TaxID=286 RepID=UPI000314782E|nr:hypothetical protein [Pseudomonas protegens]ROM22353.1 hypothetical protein BK645_22565 [Pseudomonas protegens]ROM41901.1 hypothetical protein BK646_00570 [Pseudomonas protegens]